jgi:hypothetical protein
MYANSHLCMRPTLPVSEREGEGESDGKGAGQGKSDRAEDGGMFPKA